MKWIGLTGGLGSGKTTVANRLRELGFKVADADIVARKVLEESPALKTELVDKYGPTILSADGQVDRKALGNIVFKSKVELNWLESQIHPFVREEVSALKKEWASKGNKIAFYDVPLLFEKKMEDQFDAVVVVSAPTPEIFKRVAARDKLDDTSIHERRSNQIPLDKKRSTADYILENDQDLPHLYSQIDKMLSKL